MKKMAVIALCVLTVAVLWLSCFRSEARLIVRDADLDLGLKPVAASVEFARAGAHQGAAISPAMTASSVSTPLSIIHPDVHRPASLLHDVRTFDHLLADTSPEQAMAPQKSDTTDTAAARTR